MPFINNKKLTEIRAQAKSGNEKALMILQAMRKSAPQQDIDGLVEDYYNVSNNAPVIEENKAEIQESMPPVELQPEIIANTENFDDVVETPDLTSILDTEMDGLLDENELDDMSFSGFLSDKRKNTLREKKGSDYFKAYDALGREKYLNDKVEGYKSKFNNRLKDIERRYNDMETSINNYSSNVNNMLDDGVVLDMDAASSAYNDLTNNEEVMGSVGRHWDNGDNEAVMNYLQELITIYGKQNVIAALNSLKGDNTNYRDFLNNQVDTEIGRYSKSIEKLLK